ncbi:MAG: protein translocase subunit SecD, partial [Zetaproteobacteria bacterium]
MARFPRWKYALIAAVFVLFAAAALPNLVSVPSWWPFKKPLNLGLDLRGGVHLTLDVDVDAALARAIESDADEARAVLRKAGIRYRRISPGKDGFVVEVRDEGKAAEAERLLRDEFRASYELARSGRVITLKLKPARAEEVRDSAVDQAIEVVRNRIDALGTTEPVIAKQGKHRIVVQIPGFEDTARAKRVLGRTAQLEFHLVDEKADVEKALREGPPPGDIILYGPPPERRPYVLKRRVELSGAEVVDARVSIDSRFNEYAVTLKFNRKGARKFDR